MHVCEVGQVLAEDEQVKQTLVDRFKVCHCGVRSRRYHCQPYPCPLADSWRAWVRIDRDMKGCVVWRRRWHERHTADAAVVALVPSNIGVHRAPIGSFHRWCLRGLGSRGRTRVGGVTSEGDEKNCKYLKHGIDEGLASHPLVNSNSGGSRRRSTSPTGSRRSSGCIDRQLALCR